MTIIGRDLPVEAFDRNAKRLLSNKRVFAYIIREADERFRGMEIEQIMGTIDDNNSSDYLLSIDKEYNIGTGKTISDNCFIINVPDGSKLLVNMEFQASRNSSHLQLVYRMYKTMYCQLMRLNEYKMDGILEIGDEVLTIWINCNPPAEDANTVCFIPQNGEDPETSGRGNGRQGMVVFNLSTKWDDAEGALRLLDLIFRVSASDERDSALKRFNINMEMIMSGGTDMNSLSEVLIESGRELGRTEGFAEGRTEGFTEGRTEKALGQIRTFMGLGHAFDEAFDLFAEPDMDREGIRSLVEKE